MSVQPGKTTAQRTRCASTHTEASSASVLTAPKFQTLHMWRRHPCKNQPQSSFYIRVLTPVVFGPAQHQKAILSFSSNDALTCFSTKFPSTLCLAQALRTKPLSFGQQGVHADAQFLLLPLPGRGVQPVRSSGHVPGVGVAPDRWHPSLLPPGRTTSTAPLHGAALWPGDGAADVGDPSAGPGHTGGRGGDERAGEASPDREVHHQSHHVCFPVRVLVWEGWINAEHKS